MEQWAAALEATQLAVLLRGSAWVYPLVNAGHILGVALLIGAIVPLDLRLLGLWPAVPAAHLVRILSRTAAMGLGLAVVCGMLLFIARASEYFQSALFVAKMGVAAAATLNALFLRWHWRGSSAGEEEPAAAVRLAAGFSLAAWPTALVLGRLVGYF